MPMPFDVRPDLRATSGPYLSTPTFLGTGTTAQRPVLTSAQRGYFNDTTIGRQIFWGGVRWHVQDGTPTAAFGG